MLVKVLKRIARRLLILLAAAVLDAIIFNNLIKWPWSATYFTGIHLFDRVLGLVFFLIIPAHFELLEAFLDLFRDVRTAFMPLYLSITSQEPFILSDCFPPTLVDPSWRRNREKWQAGIVPWVLPEDDILRNNKKSLLRTCGYVTNFVRAVWSLFS